MEARYPVMYLDALMAKVLDGARVSNKSAYIAFGADVEGAKPVVGIWLQASEARNSGLGVRAFSSKRADRDGKTLTLQENRAKTVIAGEQSDRTPRFFKTTNGIE